MVPKWKKYQAVSDYVPASIIARLVNLSLSVTAAWSDSTGPVRHRPLNYPRSVPGNEPVDSFNSRAQCPHYRSAARIMRTPLESKLNASPAAAPLSAAIFTCHPRRPRRRRRRRRGELWGEERADGKIGTFPGRSRKTNPDKSRDLPVIGACELAPGCLRGPHNPAINIRWREMRGTFIQGFRSL